MSGLASLFSMMARGETDERREYTIHRDIPLGRWNVFALVNGREEFVCAFERLEDAQAWVLIQSA